MEILNEKYQNFLNAYNALGDSIEAQEGWQDLKKHLPHGALTDTKLPNSLNTAVIKNFELAYETAWKFLKQYLKQMHELDVASPKAVFRACRERGVLSDVLVNELLELADLRNLTAHVYNRILAQEVGMSVEEHYKIFAELTKLMSIQSQ